jgi:hypothetical protein
MPRYENLPVALQVQMTNIFTPRNYCFMTSEGTRSPTFYFAQGGLAHLNTANLCGRVRTLHPKGPLIDITRSSKRHFFFANLVDRDTVRKIVKRMSKDQRTNGDARFFLEMVGRVYGTAPQDGNYHYEYTVPAGHPKRVTRTHPSGGRVRVAPRLTQQHVVRLLDRVLGDNAAVEIDGTQHVALGVQPVRATVVDPGGYLASL